MDRIVVVVDPQRSDAADRLSELLSGVVDQVTPERADDLTPAVARAVEDGAQVVPGVGGDGTQRSVAAHLAGTSTRLAVIPGCTVNLLAQVLGLGDLESAAAAGPAEPGAGWMWPRATARPSCSMPVRATTPP